jgi:glycosyltransferase involved in cell wall biosynthesis
MSATAATMPRPPDLIAIEAHLGRPLRVLHIGNIANNAYYNAMIQRRCGVEADVICYDYYHVMSCPEWEDAVFEGEVEPNQPNWWGTSLKGWSRPEWFAQGPAAGCINYQHARALGFGRLSKLLWTYLEARSLGHVRYMAEVEGKPVQKLTWRFKLAIMTVMELGLQEVNEPTTTRPDAVVPKSANQEPPPAPLPPRNPGSAWRALLRPAVRAVFSVVRGVRHLLGRILRAVRHVTLRVIKPMLIKLAAKALAAPYRAQAASLKLWADEGALARRDAGFAAGLARLRAECEGLPPSERARVEDYAQDHPRKFFRALRDYDIVQGYAIDGFIPFMNGMRNYVSYEHGTLRELPFGDNFYGAVTRTAFLPAPAVFVTNSDVMPATVRMGLDPARIMCLPHPFHEEKIDRFLGENAHLVPPDGPAVFFSPTRQHWIDTSGSWTKGNDVFLRAAGRMADEGRDFRIILVEWGKEVEASKTLIAELGVADKVSWVPTMQKHELWEAYARAHAVVDQFTLPALGAVGVEVMALGRRLITAIDAAQLGSFFGEAPPCLHASTVDECAAQMRSVIADIDDKAGRGPAVRRWIKARHSAQRIMDIQAQAYAMILRGDENGLKTLSQECKA